MFFNVSQFDSSYNFAVEGISNIHKPRDNTMMFVGKKLGKYLENLEKVKECLIFIDMGMNINEGLSSKNCFIETKNPALDYIKAVTPFHNKHMEYLKTKKYTHTNEGYTMGENIEVGDSVLIEPGCFIDHGVKIGNNTTILNGAVIRGNVVIGNKCIIKENAVIGSYGFTFAKDNKKNNVRIPSLGGVLIMDDVEIGSFATICSGTAYPTVINDNVKIDDHVHVAHDVNIGKKTSIAAGTVISGYVQIGEEVYIGAGATIMNRICIGDKAVIGLAARVYKNVKEMQTVLNEPAVTIDKLAERQVLINRMKLSK